MPNIPSGRLPLSASSPQASRGDLAWVAGQAALLAALLLTPAGWPLSWLAPLRPLGFGLAGLGLAIVGVAAWQLRQRRSLTVWPSPRADAGLLTGGLYQHVRHPVYSGVLACAGGFAIVAASGRHFLLWGMLWAFFTAKSVWEERLLTQRFGGYAAYAARTPRFLPRFSGPSLP